MRKLGCLFASALAPALLYAHSNGLPIGYAGAPSDNGGQTCIQCHSGGPPVNQGQGRLVVIGNSYTPGVTQGVTVEIDDQTALKFGGQVIRSACNDPPPHGKIVLFGGGTHGRDYRIPPQRR